MSLTPIGLSDIKYDTEVQLNVLYIKASWTIKATVTDVFFKFVETKQYHEKNFLEFHFINTKFYVLGWEAVTHSQ